jgi:flagellar protein FlbT
MALVIDLKPNEKLIIGSSVVINDKQRTRLRIEGDAPILREKDTLLPEDATTPSKRLYLTIQDMYLADSRKAMEHLDNYFNLLQIIKQAAPDFTNALSIISAHILQGTYYKALKLMQELIDDDNPVALVDTGIEQTSNIMKMEAELLTQSAQQLSQAHDTWESLNAQERETAISYNRKLWMVFFDGVNDPNHIKNQGTNSDRFDITLNIIHLYDYIYKSSTKILETGDKNKIKTLIAINTEAAKALLKG